MQEQAHPVKRREILGWALYDFANSSYTTVVITAVYSIFFVGHIVPPGDGPRDGLWSLAIVLSTILALVLSPLIGAIVDVGGGKKRWLVGASIACASATAGLALVGQGQIAAAILLVVVSNAAFMLCESLSAAFLPELSTPRTMGRISGMAWGIGYFGGMASVVLALKVIITANPDTDYAQFFAQNQWAMAATGVFFILAALPTFLLVRDRGTPAPGWENASMGRLMKQGLTEIAQSAKMARQNPVLFRFLLAFMVYMAGLDAVIKFVGIYASEEVQLTTGQFATLFLILQLSAAGGAFLFGWLETLLGPRRTVLLTLGWWVLATLLIYGLDPLAAVLGVTKQTAFFGLGVMAGMGLGSVQSSSRTVVGLLAPPGQNARMFGFWGLFARAASILGASFGVASDIFSRHTAILVITAFFIVGAAMLWTVDIDGEAKRQAAKRAEAPA